MCWGINQQELSFAEFEVQTPKSIIVYVQARFSLYQMNLKTNQVSTFHIRSGACKFHICQTSSRLYPKIYLSFSRVQIEPFNNLEKVFRIFSYVSSTGTAKIHGLLKERVWIVFEGHVIPTPSVAWDPHTFEISASCIGDGPTLFSTTQHTYGSLGHAILNYKNV